MKSLFLSTIVFLFILSGCATQNEMTSLDQRVSEMELRDSEASKNREAIKSQVEESTKIRESMDQELRKQSASLHALIEELREEIRVLNGKLEEIDYNLKQQKKAVEVVERRNEDSTNRLTEIAAKNEERIVRVEQYLNLEPSGKIAKAAPEIAAGIPGKGQKEPSEQELYTLGKQAFDQGNADLARKRFQELIERYPKSENADNAQFWIGEIYYREKWYEKAILEYQKVIENYPKGNKVPSALLKQGLAFSNLGDKANARLILEELIKKYPNSNEAKIAGEKLKEFG
jgi:tol-pal system protein YbgF